MPWAAGGGNAQRVNEQRSRFVRVGVGVGLGYGCGVLVGERLGRVTEEGAAHVDQTLYDRLLPTISDELGTGKAAHRDFDQVYS